MEHWLRQLMCIDGRPMAPPTKAKIRSLMSALFNHAIRYEWLEQGRNPILFVRQSAKRQRIPECPEPAELQALLSQLDRRLDLAAAVPIVANWSMTSIPRAISADHVRQLLARIDRRTAVGRRDDAILLMLARLGLRAGEVVSLELGDIDWNLGQVNVRGKSGQRNRLPLPTEVGKAIAVYLRRGRPHSTRGEWH